jgi:hypothetical protein
MKRSSAFTLIELLISLAMVVIVTSTLFFYAQISIKAIFKASSSAGALQVTRFVTGKIVKDIYESGGAMNGSSPSKLILPGITYELMDKKIRRTDGGDVSYITSENEILGLKFAYITSKFIRIFITPVSGEEYTINVYARN